MRIVSLLPSQPSVAAALGILSRNIRAEYIELSSINELKIAVENLQKINERVLLFTEFSQSNVIGEVATLNTKMIVIMLINESVHKFIKNIDLSYVNCFVANENNAFDPRELAIMIKKFSVNDIAGLDKYLGFGAMVNNFGILNPEQKHCAIAEIENFVIDIGGTNDRKRFKEYSRKVCELVDELILNALFDSELGERENNNYVNFMLAKEKAIQVSWGFDGEIFGISVKDSFGRIKKQTIIRYLSETTSHNFSENDSEKKGFGIRIAFEKMHNFVVNDNPGNFTEIICLLSFEKRFRDFDSKLKSFHYFSL